MSYTFLRGINFDTPMSFTCMGKNYLLDVVLVSYDNSNSNPQYLHIDVSTLVSIEWTNEANNLCMSGKLTVVSTDGKLGNFFNSTPCFVGVKAEFLNKFGNSENDGDFVSSIKFDEDSSGKNSIFEHIFIVDKFEIKGREKNTVVYTLYLKSLVWTRMISTAVYSNCNLDKYSEGTKIYTIIKEILETAFKDFEITKGKKISFLSSFEKIYYDNPPKLRNYITYANDKVFDAIRFLQSRLYFLGENNVNRAPGLSYLRFNEFNNEVDVIDFDGEIVSQTDILAGSLISMGAMTFEQFVSGKEQKYSSMNNLGFLSFIMNFFGYETINIKSLGQNVINRVSPEELSYFYNQKDSKFGDGKKFDISALKKILFGENGLFPDSLRYGDQFSTSDLNDESFFQMLDILKNRDVMIFETNGTLGHVPGMFFNIVGSGSGISDDVNANSKKEGENDKNTNVTGIFHVLKTTHVIQPNNHDGERFREKLYMVKTWKGDKSK